MKYFLIAVSTFLSFCVHAQNEPRINYTKLKETIVEARDTLPVSYNMMQVDAFGKQRVSIPTSLFNGKLLRDKQPAYWDEYLAGTSTSVFKTNDAMVSLSVTNSGTVIRQTFQRFNYQAGKSQMVMMTGILDPKRLSGNAVARMGQFTASNSSTDNPEGFWFEADATNVYVCIGKPYGTGSGVKRIPQSQWNEDRVDGSGPSKKFVKFDKAQIFGFDYEWLGVGSVRFFIVQDNMFNVIHRFTHENELDAVYLSTPNLPLRYDLNASSGTGTLIQICSTVMNEPNEQPIGLSYFIGNSSNYTYSTDTYGILTGYAMRTGYMDRLYFPKTITTLSTDNVANYPWLITIGAQYTNNVTWVDDTANLGLRIANPVVDAGITNLGYVLVSGFVAADSSAEFDPIDLLRVGKTISGQSQELLLLVRAVSGSPELSGGMSVTIVE